MAVLLILTGATNVVLRAKAEPVKQVTKELLKLADDMLATTKASDGIGLAAPQIGVSKQMFVAKITGRMVVMFNPKILWQSDDKVVAEEGCLSLPNVAVQVPRAREITLEYMNTKGQTEQRKLRNMDARVVQHEVDHLNGILIVDYRL